MNSARAHKWLPAIVATVAFTLLLSLAHSALAQWREDQGPAANKQQEINAFQLSMLNDSWRDAVLLIRRGKLKQAERNFRSMIDLFPPAPESHYFLASVLARQKKFDAAYERLTIAVDRGFSNLALIKADPGFESLRQQDRVKSLLRLIEENAAKTTAIKRRAVSPAMVGNGIALVDEDNTLWDAKWKILRATFRFDGIGEAASKTVQSGTDVIQKQLNEWYSQGLAAGNIGDLYDNHDRGHSMMSATLFPQLTIVKYGSAARNAGVDNGFNSKMFFNAITFGNSSTASAGRSQARHALTLPGFPEILFLQYFNNQMYIYPEHRDYDPKRGDLLPANTPYMILSQGSSGSDQPFLRAVASILAAFKPDVKAYLRQTRLVMPTVQMIFRRGQKWMDSEAQYLTARAHPPVFWSKDIDLVKMINLANQLNIGDIPPMVRLRVLSESGPRPGIDDFAGLIPETLFDTPGAIARVVRSTAYEKRMTISAEQTKPLGAQKLEFHWVVLRGDASLIKIIPRNSRGSVVDVVVSWHERRLVPGQPGMTTDRVEIGVFVHNGKYFSAPAFVNFLYPANQKRIYNEKNRIVSIDHADPQFTERYREPRLFVRRDWKDIYRYDRQSNLIGWQRRRGKWITNFTRHGAKVLETDDQGRPIKARVTRYKIETDKRGARFIVEFSTPAEKLLFYRYNGPDDRMGRLYQEPAQ